MQRLWISRSCRDHEGNMCASAGQHRKWHIAQRSSCYRYYGCRADVCQVDVLAAGSVQMSRQDSASSDQSSGGGTAIAVFPQQVGARKSWRLCHCWAVLAHWTMAQCLTPGRRGGQNPWSSKSAAWWASSAQQCSSAAMRIASPQASVPRQQTCCCLLLIAGMFCPEHSHGTA